YEAILTELVQGGGGSLVDLFGWDVGDTFDNVSRLVVVLHEPGDTSTGDDGGFSGHYLERCRVLLVHSDPGFRPIPQALQVHLGVDGEGFGLGLRYEPLKNRRAQDDVVQVPPLVGLGLFLLATEYDPGHPLVAVHPVVPLGVALLDVVMKDVGPRQCPYMALAPTASDDRHDFTEPSPASISPTRTVPKGTGLK